MFEFEDTKLLSDYPEEQEWLIGFCYVRMLQIEARYLCGDPNTFGSLRTAPISSLTKEVFLQKLTLNLVTNYLM